MDTEKLFVMLAALVSGLKPMAEYVEFLRLRNRPQQLAPLFFPLGDVYLRELRRIAHTLPGALYRMALAAKDYYDDQHSRYGDDANYEMGEYFWQLAKALRPKTPAYVLAARRVKANGFPDYPAVLWAYRILAHNHIGLLDIARAYIRIAPDYLRVAALEALFYGVVIPVPKSDNMTEAEKFLLHREVIRLTRLQNWYEAALITVRGYGAEVRSNHEAAVVAAARINEVEMLAEEFTR